jgi:alginate O-acetyltransferase complex protein AlgI
LTIASFVFYSANQPILLLLLVGSIFVNALASYWVEHGQASKKRFYATMGVVLNLAILAFFKYSGLIGNTIFGSISSLEEFLVAIPLPIGISFFTFQGISLVVDTYKEEHTKEGYKDLVPRNFWLHFANTCFFISFFPQLVAGPIGKAHHFLPQIGPKYFKNVEWEISLRIIVVGYFLKMVIADNIKDHTSWIEFPYFQGFSSSALVVLLYGYSMQIFADFAGYSLIAIGISRLFGYKLDDNFDYPYISKSITEFWRRWHISLSSFLKEYLYIPLGGNRYGSYRTYLNLMIVMFLGGLWHGGAWSYAVWGSFHGVALAIERFFKDKIRIKANFFNDAVRIFLVFFFVSLAWLLFKLPDFKYAIMYIQSIFLNTSKPLDNISKAAMVLIILYSIPVLLYHFYYLHKQYVSQAHLSRRLMTQLEPYIFGILLFLIFTNSGSTGAFIYFQF